MNNEILQNWVKNLSIIDQSTLLSALRGIDHDEIAETIKPLIKMYRHVVINVQTPKDKNNYSTTKVYDADSMTTLLIKGKKYSLHWYEHMKKAIEIIINKHPNNYVRAYWNQVLDSEDKLIEISENTVNENNEDITDTVLPSVEPEPLEKSIIDKK